MPFVFGCITPHPPVLLPEIGGRDAERVRHTVEGFRALSRQLQAARPELVLLLSPHGVGHADAMGVVASPDLAGSFHLFGAPEISVRCFNDPALATAIHDEAIRSAVPCRISHEPFYELDHGSLVPLHLLRPALESVPIIPLTFCALPLARHQAFGQVIQKVVERSPRRIAFIASGDLSHRLIPGAPAGYDPLGRLFDERLVELIRLGKTDEILALDDDLIRRAGQCGLRSIVVLLGALSGLEWTPEIISYEGPFGVGYLVASLHLGSVEFDVPDPGVERLEKPAERGDSGALGTHPLLKLARETVEQYVAYHTRPTLSELCPELRGPAGVFVSIYKGGALRGCMGTIDPAHVSVAEETITNAITSAMRDPRFPAVEIHELPLLSYSIDVLGQPQRIHGLEALDPRRYGVVVESGPRRGLLLPDLQGVDTAREQVEIARRKADIPLGAPLTLYRFTAMRYSER